MKRFICAAFAAALLVPGSWALSARAHDGPEHEDDRGGPPPHEMSEKMAGRLKEKLGLSDDQAAKLKDAMKAHRETMKPLHEAQKASLEKLHKQVEDKASDADIKATLETLKSGHKAIAESEQKFRESLGSFLTPTQQAKMALGMMGRMHERMEGRKRRDGDRPERGERAGRREKPHDDERRGPPSKDDDHDDDGE